MSTFISNHNGMNAPYAFGEFVDAAIDPRLIHIVFPKYFCGSVAHKVGATTATRGLESAWDILIDSALSREDAMMKASVFGWADRVEPQKGSAPYIGTKVESVFVWIIEGVHQGMPFIGRAVRATFSTTWRQFPHHGRTARIHMFTY
jgi:hypothetical protein